MAATQFLDVMDASPVVALEGYPFLTRITTKLWMHTEALISLFSSNEPPLPSNPQMHISYIILWPTHLPRGLDLSYSIQYPNG